MPIVVEDGTGVAGANAYLDQTTFELYADDRGLSYAGKTDDQIEQAIIRATSWIDATYRARWLGVRTYGSSQALLWPRRQGIIVDGVYIANGPLTTITDSEGLAIANDAIPAALISATAEATYRELVAPGSLAPDMKRGGGIAEVAAGSVRVRYKDSASAHTTFTTIDNLLGGLLWRSANGAAEVDLLRA